jgi:hypothetical protein
MVLVRLETMHGVAQTLETIRAILPGCYSIRATGLLNPDPKVQLFKTRLSLNAEPTLF